MSFKDAGDAERLILQLERELGSTVKRLEHHRSGQVEEVERLNRDLVKVCEDRRELRARLELSEQHNEAMRVEMAKQLQKFAEERRSLETKVANAEASMEAARQSERMVMSQAASLDLKIQASQAEHRDYKELVRLKEQSEQRAKSQSEQLVQLRNKLAQVTEQLGEASKQRLAQEAEMKSKQQENVRLVGENQHLEREAMRARELERQVEINEERLKSTRESLQSALRLNETREKQIIMLQEALTNEKTKTRKGDDTKDEQIKQLRREISQLRERCNQTETMRLEQEEVYKKQLTSQREHTLTLSEQLSSLEESFRQSNPPKIPAPNPPRATSDLGDSLSMSLFEEVDANSIDNRVVSRALAGNDAWDVMGMRSSGESSHVAKEDSFIPDVYGIVQESMYGDPNASIVSDYVERVLKASTITGSTSRRTKKPSPQNRILNESTNSSMQSSTKVDKVVRIPSARTRKTTKKKSEKTKGIKKKKQPPKIASTVTSRMREKRAALIFK
mmetsp:Transcript_970/g.1155  ORF Transcript_970/g.1155 Transcript_970/m.1155 type:complete len:506 (-) Transcript_970:3277-4794(-)